MPSCSSHLNKAAENIRQQNTKTEDKNKKYTMIPTPCPSLPPHPNINQPPPPPPFPLPTITMDMAFLAQMRQSNKHGSVKNVEIISLHLGSGVGP